MTTPSALKAFGSQIDDVNARRNAAGLPPLERDRAINDADRVWNAMLSAAKVRLREQALHNLGRDLANNFFTNLILVHEIRPEFRNYISRLASGSRT